MENEDMSIEQFPQEKSGEATPSQERQRQESERLSRFGEGKAGKIARILMLATALGGVYEGVVHREDIVHEGQKIAQGIKDFKAEGERMRALHEGMGCVIKKEFIPGMMQPVMAGRSAGFMPSSDMWRVTVSTNGVEAEIKVSKEEFEKYQAGDEVSVEYTEPSPGEKDLMSIKPADTETPSAAQNK